MDLREKSTELEIVEALESFGPAYMRWVSACLPKEGVSYARLRLLAQLYEHGELMMSSLKEKLNVSATNITTLVDALEKESIVERHPHPSDRRATLIVLTEAARKTLGQQMSDHKSQVAQLFMSLSESDKQKLLELLREVNHLLDTKGMM